MSKKVVLITGANGMLARGLAKELREEYAVRFLTRRKKRDNEFLWDVNKKYIEPGALLGVDKIVHLAGASIADKRWTKKRKKLIMDSRVKSANLILSELKKQKLSVDSFVSASAVGYYGTRREDVLWDEESSKGSGFLSDVCELWEASARCFETVANRVVRIRIGVVLAKEGGALGKIMQPIRYGLGASIGSGKQYMPWVHINDLVRVFKWALDEDTVEGAFNAVSPEHVTNTMLTKKIAKCLEKPLFLPHVPEFVLKAVLGEMASMLLEGNRVSSEKLLNRGFRFEHERIEETLRDLL